ncbi:thiol:disulfide interchange protein DsbD [Arcicella aurantiaca]|uniref:Thiol:disulfide interchange protein DsbD n=1 Tax=Arcicella aurantiaca TaxID=591202 RepID=A0A316DQ12_9BACT|nr:cytochrome c biogenesis protein CcdA [Arcicella aurantiaca]PWK20064.1 thiol:disulfide interchange protein DsbD [Arcicella aurantiaca]
MQTSQSLLSFLSVAFLAGLATIFMPCIYPIMPMTVSFFTKQTNGKSKALFYGLSIMLIFGLIGFLTMITGASFLNFISTHWIPNLAFFIVFIVFGVSLLGAFEIVLPHNWVNKVDGLSDSGGWIGIFFMALTLVVVSFSCTAPFVGSLLVMAAQGEVFRPLWGMLAFGLPFAIVFSSLAMFPQWLKSLPKSGGWMNEMKAVMGLAEFALALKFLSNIDQTYHFGLISRTTFLICWILIFTFVAFYIAGIVRLPKDSKIKKYAPSRLFFTGLFLVFSGYMATGIFGKSLPMLSGILPPIENIGTLEGVSADKLRPMAHGLVGFSDYEDALEYAQKVNKPVLIDFTGYACANCRKMEESVWVKPEILAKLKNDFVIASLYVDDKKELPKPKQYISKYDDELKSTVGDKNMDLEISKFNNNAQPFYVLISPKGEQIGSPIGYCSLSEFSNFLHFSKK